MVDTSGNGSTSWTGTIIISTPVLDEIPPVIVSSTVTAKTDTAATIHVVTSEQLKKLRVRYRVVGTTAWTEQTLIPTTLAFDINLTSLLTGQAYEYQYTLDDNSGNQDLTGWVGV
mgnify:CR=1 FL=1